MQRLTPCLLAGMLALVGLASGCWHSPNAPVRRDLVVGEYVYHCEDPGSPHDSDKLTLRADGTYLLVHMPGGHPGPREEGAWELYNDNPPRVAVKDYVHPLLVRGQNVRLLIDDDLGRWYEKTTP